MLNLLSDRYVPLLHQAIQGAINLHLIDRPEIANTLIELFLEVIAAHRLGVQPAENSVSQCDIFSSPFALSMLLNSTHIS